MNMNMKKLANVGVLTALSFIMMILIRFPMFLPFLIYEPGDIPILIISFLYGPLTAIVVTLINSILMAIFTGLGGPFGAFMHFLATGVFVGVAGYIYRIKHTKKGAIIGLVIGSIAMTSIMALANLTLNPIFYGIPYEENLKFLLPGIVPFNLTKSFLNSGITLLLYKKLANFLRQKGLLKAYKSV